MYLVVIAWLYVTLMMAVADAGSPQGTLLGAIVTFLLYGLGPLALVVYLMSTPARKRKIKAREAAELAAWRAEQAQEQAQEKAGASDTPDAGGEAAGAAQASGIAAVRKEP